MVRVVTLATIAVIGVLMTGALPPAQSFNIGPITITRPIILLSPARGPLEATSRLLHSPAAPGPARQFVERVWRRLAPLAPPEAEETRAAVSSITGAVPRLVGTLASPGALEAAEAALLTSRTTERGGEWDLDPLGHEPLGAPALDSRPGFDPARLGHGGSDQSRAGRPGHDGRQDERGLSVGDRSAN